MEVKKERINEVAYALLLATLSKEPIELDPEKLKRKLGNMTQTLQFLPEQFKAFSREELQVACKVICHDLVDYAFSFTWSDKKKGKKK